MPAMNSPGWYGKLPSTGDFIQHRLSEKAVSVWSNWFQGGLMTWHEHYASGSFTRAPAWNFVLPATLGLQYVQLGVLVPSKDKVGRAWPLLVTQAFTLNSWHPAQLSLAGEWFNDATKKLTMAVQQVESVQTLNHQLSALPALPLPGNSPAILGGAGYQDLPTALAWADAAQQFDAQQYTSYWWSPPTADRPLKTHRHSGNLTTHLFALLFNPETKFKAGRSGLYPPMFD